jgi:ubiquinone/menaquinone biosynthesis C-methylase UbiE
MSSPSYKDVFSKRAKSHDEAFRMYPNACRTEVKNCLSLAQLLPGEILLDLPSAGGFLSTYVDTPDIKVIAVDPSPDLHALCSQIVPDSRLAPLDCLPLEDETVDAAICLAGLHHELEPELILAEIYRVLKKGVGRLVVAEVEHGSSVANFLNGFVNENNSGGHEGFFVDDNFIKHFESAGFLIDNDEIKNYHWPFDSKYDLGDCLQRMFGMDMTTPEKIYQAVANELGVDEFEGGKIGMRWSLRLIRAWRPN